MDGSRPPFAPTSDSTSASEAEGSLRSYDSRINVASNEFTPLAPAFQRHTPNELISMLGQQEPRPADTAPMSLDLDEMMRGFHINGPEMAFEPDTESTHSNYSFVDNNNINRPESAASSRLWSDVGSLSSHPNEQMTTFDFLVKSVSAANNYVSLLSREQLSVLQALRPSLLYDFLQEIAKVRSEKRTRRALPHECAFCKNNGENEEHYTSHLLKDWRGRVLCPVLRAFRCPRCGSTGDRAHTIKYCPENDADRHGLSARRRMPPSVSLYGNGLHGPNESFQSTYNAGSAPPPSPSQNDRLSDTRPWSPFG